MGPNHVRRGTWKVLAVCLLTVALSGCTSTPPGDSDHSSPPSSDADLANDPVPAAGQLSLGFGDCTIQSAVIAAPSEIVAGEIPEGFAPVYGDAAGATSLIGFSGTACANATSQESPAAHTEFRFYAFVEPSPEWQNESVDDYLLLFFVTASDASTADLYDAWGHWVETRAVAVSSEDVGASALGTVNSAHGSEEWEIRTAVDSSSEECYDGKHMRSFAEGPNGIEGYVDIMTGPSCAWIGSSKVMLPGAPAADPMDLVVWAGLNGILTGQGRHTIEPTNIAQEYMAFS